MNKKKESKGIFLMKKICSKSPKPQYKSRMIYRNTENPLENIFKGASYFHVYMIKGQGTEEQSCVVAGLAFKG